MSSTSSVLAKQSISRRAVRPRLKIARQNAPDSRKTQPSRHANILSFPEGKPIRRIKGLAVVILTVVLGLISVGVPLYIELKSVKDFRAIDVQDTAVSASALSDYLITEPIRSGESEPVGDGPTAFKVSTYRVRRGDTLSSIANKFGLRVDTLISYNGIKRARGLLAGTVLRIPNGDGLSYAVRRGDTLGSIATRHGVSLNSLLDWNNLESEVIRVGQPLFVPGARLSATQRDMVLGRLFVYPTRGYLSSRFGWRINPFTGTREHHNGLDIANKTGTSVWASMAGRVAMVGVNPVYGRYIIIQHAEGFQSLYAHLSRILVSEGTRVTQSQKIGIMGNTGYSTGPHLHFTIFKNHVPVDPLRYLH